MRIAIALASFTALWVGCTDAGRDPLTSGPDDTGIDAGTGAPPAVTYYRDVKPILDHDCVGCHVEGGLAPFALDTVELATANAAIIGVVTASRKMPPWPP